MLKDICTISFTIVHGGNKASSQFSEVELFVSVINLFLCIIIHGHVLHMKNLIGKPVKNYIRYSIQTSLQNKNKNNTW